jgi:hypothetical protein
LSKNNITFGNYGRLTAGGQYSLSKVQRVRPSFVFLSNNSKIVYWINLYVNKRLLDYFYSFCHNNFDYECYLHANEPSLGKSEDLIMKQLLSGILISIILASCSPAVSAQTQITDNGNPGIIKVFVFNDLNSNGFLDQGEPGLTDTVSVIPVELSCPVTNVKDIVRTETGPNGEAIFKDLKPGHYCVFYMGSNTTTTRLDFTVDLSSDQEKQVGFGMMNR